jgi:hypothetical protein
MLNGRCNYRLANGFIQISNLKSPITACKATFWESAAYPSSLLASRRSITTTMKLIIAGATGFVAREVIRQSLSRPEITSVVALARSSVAVPEKLPAGADASKLKSVVIQDYEVYSDDIKKEFSGAGACIWYVWFFTLEIILPPPLISRTTVSNNLVLT